MVCVQKEYPLSLRQSENGCLTATLTPELFCSPRYPACIFPSSPSSVSITLPLVVLALQSPELGARNMAPLALGMDWLMIGGLMAFTCPVDPARHEMYLV